jgi:hypothetical protein
MKAVADEEKRQENVRKIVKLIYNHVVSAAKSSIVTSYTVQLQITDPRAAVKKVISAMPASEHTTLHPFDMSLIFENRDEVIQQLRSLFPDCDVGIKTLSRGANGQYYDASTLDESALRFIDKRYDQTHLVVDWS